MTESWYFFEASKGNRRCVTIIGVRWIDGSRIFCVDRVYDPLDRRNEDITWNLKLIINIL